MTQSENSTFQWTLCNETSENREQCHQWSTTGTYIAKIYIWLIFAFGFPGNLISLCIIIKMSRKRLVTSLFYVGLLAVVDNTSILLKIIENLSYNGHLYMNDISCRFLFSFGLTFAMYANWILVAMATERFIAVLFPLRISIIWSMKKAVCIIVGIFLFICAVSGHLFWSVKHYKNYTCGMYDWFLQNYLNIWFFASSFLYSFIPATCLFVLNTIIIIRLRKSSSQRRSLMSESDTVAMETRKQEKQITIMLVTVAVLFVVLSVPRCVFLIVHMYYKPPLDSLNYARKRLFDILSSNIADTNHAINFYLYFISGQKFRQSFLDVLKCRRIFQRDTSNGTTKSTEVGQGNSQL